jgi:hypothetical protein
MSEVCLIGRKADPSMPNRAVVERTVRLAAIAAPAELRPEIE